MKNKDKKISKEEEARIAKIEQEKMEIFQKSSEKKTELNFIDKQGELKKMDERKEFILNSTDDPEKKYDAYYKEIEKNLKLIINPKKADKQTKEAFQILREEKNIFLTGKRKNDKGIRGADARMSYTTNMEIAANLIYDNIATGSNPFDLYIAFRDKNIEMGYYNDLLKDNKSSSMRGDDKISDVLKALKDKK